MSKLNGNGRWESKMVLTEHVEQYDARGKLQGRPTAEEFTMIRDYILLPHMLTMVQRSFDELQRSSILMKRLYLLSTKVILDKISKEKFDLGRELKKRSIRVFDDETADTVIYYRFFCRGYEEQFGIVRDV